MAFALVCVLGLEGCAAAALSVAGLVGGSGLDYTLNGIVNRTYAAPVAGTRLAALQTLKRMGMTVEKNTKQDKGWIITATASNRLIEIELEPLSTLSTRVQVVVSHTDITFFKDSSTSNGILDQMSVDLASFSFERHRFATAQMLLSELGFDPGQVDGVMGRKTRNAIRRFQRRNAIRPDGDLSPKLIAMLRKQKKAHDGAANTKKSGASRTR